MNRAGTTVRMEPLLFPCAAMSYRTLQLLQKTGQIERTVDQDFSSEEAKYKMCVPPFFPPPGPSCARLRKHDQIRERVWHPPEGREILPGCYARYACQPCPQLPLPRRVRLTSSPCVQPCLRRSSTLRKRSTPFTRRPIGPQRTLWPLTHIGVPSKNSMLVLVASWCVTLNCHSYRSTILDHTITPFLLITITPCSFFDRMPPIGQPSWIRLAR
jgi:hypothetical protein